MNNKIVGRLVAIFIFSIIMSISYAQGAQRTLLSPINEETKGIRTNLEQNIFIPLGALADEFLEKHEYNELVICLSIDKFTMEIWSDLLDYINIRWFMAKYCDNPERAAGDILIHLRSNISNVKDKITETTDAMRHSSNDKLIALAKKLLVAMQEIHEYYKNQETLLEKVK